MSCSAMKAWEMRSHLKSFRVQTSWKVMLFRAHRNHLNRERQLRRKSRVTVIFLMTLLRKIKASRRWRRRKSLIRRWKRVAKQRTGKILLRLGRRKWIICPVTTISSNRSPLKSSTARISQSSSYPPPKASMKTASSIKRHQSSHWYRWMMKWPIKL